LSFTCSVFALLAIQCSPTAHHAKCMSGARLDPVKNPF
jgi:hypothetical protein